MSKRLVTNINDYPSSPSSNMVESKEELEELARRVEHIKLSKLRIDYLEEDFTSLLVSRGWKNLSEEDKIQRAVEEADFKIKKWHLEIEETSELPKTFKEWRKRVEEEFNKPSMTKAQYVRESQKDNEKLSDFLKRMNEIGSSLKIDPKERMGYALEGIRKDQWIFKVQILKENFISEEIIELVKEMERSKENYVSTRKYNPSKFYTNQPIVCNNCNKPGHIAQYCRLPKRNVKVKEINLAEEVEEALIKDESIYFFNKFWKVIMDTGATNNYIAQEIPSAAQIKIETLKDPIIRYTVDNRTIKIEKYVEIEFIHEKRKFKEIFFILPGARTDKIILGKNWLMKSKNCRKFECRIDTPANAIVTEKTWQVPKSLEEETKKALMKLIENKRIGESTSSWVNNLNPVIKPDGSVRITTNLVKLNELVKQDQYSLPNQDKMLFSLKDQEFFSKIDLKDGFFQIPLREQDRHKTAFRFGHRLYEWLVMPMGFKNAPAIFQRFMDHVLKNEIGKSCHVYVDDILIFGKNEKEHDESLKRIKDILKENGLEINETKSIYKVKEIIFLNRKLSKNVVMKNEDDDEAIKNFATPRNKKELQSFLGLANYYRNFTANLAQTSSVLYDLLKDKTEFVWSNEADNAFQKIKEMLLSSEVLHQPDYTKKFILTTDACNTGLGAILSQKEGEKEYPIAYASRMLEDSEKKYSITEKECLGAIWAMERFEYYLYGKQFLLRTDHKALKKLNDGMLKSDRISRWSDRLSRFSYKVEYEKGENIPHVDALSRQFEVIDNIEEDLEDKRRIIREKHEELIHRGEKAVTKALSAEYDWKNLSKLVSEELKKCEKCSKYNVKCKRPFRAVSAFEKGEKIAYDIMGPIGNHYIISAIDYFTRKAWAQRINSRNEEKVLNFLEQVNNEMKIQTLICDNAKENLGSKVKQWAEKEGIKLHFTSPYHHESNGRIERFHRTLMDGLNKSKAKGSYDERIARVVNMYNETWHSGIGMSPIKANDPENWELLRKQEYEKKLNAESNLRIPVDYPRLAIGESVLIKNELRKSKKEVRFDKQGKIHKILENDTYLVENEGKIFKRHASQLKSMQVVEGGMLSINNSLNKYP